MRSFTIAAMCIAVSMSPLAAQLPDVSLDASLGGKAGSQRAAVSAWHPFIHIGGFHRPPRPDCPVFG